jgi:hypothetical protein
MAVMPKKAANTKPEYAEWARTTPMTNDWRPMSEFDPSKPALVHDQLNDHTFEWQPERWAGEYRQYAEEWRPGVVNWDSLLLDGWQPLLRTMR